MPEEEARGYLKKCIDSGLWVANAQDVQAQAQAQEEKATDGGSEGSDDENHYEAVREQAEAEE